LDLLIGGEKVALDSLGERLRGGRGELELDARRTLLHPARQLATLDRPDLDEHAVLVDRLHPARARGGRVELLADGDDQERVGVRALAELGDRRGALIAGLRRREADLDDL